jgi:hypothetical protein
MKKKKTYTFLIIFSFAFSLGIFTELTGLRFGGSYGAISLEELPSTLPFNFGSSIILAVFGVWFLGLRERKKESENDSE